MQDNLPSSQRSGVESAVSTLTTIAFMGTVLIFSLIVKEHSVFMASWILVVIAIIGTVGVTGSLLRQKPKTV